MPKAIRCLGGILADEVCRRVAVVAGRSRPVGRLEPAVELLAHHMAVGAGRRIVSEVGPTLGIGEGIDANPDGNAENDAKQDALNRARFHRCFRSPTSVLRTEQRALIIIEASSSASPCGMLATPTAVGDEEDVQCDAPPKYMRRTVASTCMPERWTVCIFKRDGAIRLHRNMPTAPEIFLKAIAPYRQ